MIAFNNTSTNVFSPDVDFKVTRDLMCSVPCSFFSVVHADERGSFQELWSSKAFSSIFEPSTLFAAGFNENNELITANLPSIKQVNYAINLKAGTLRGMHWQTNRSPAGKFVMCLRGSIQDVVVDLRKDFDKTSFKTDDTFGKFKSYILRSECDKTTGDRLQALWVPPGFAHGYLALEDDTQVLYLQTHSNYDPKESCEFNPEKSLNPIEWVSRDYLKIRDYIVSDKDRKAPSLAQLIVDSPGKLFDIAKYEM